jgi:hypothetical protein
MPGGVIRFIGGSRSPDGIMCRLSKRASTRSTQCKFKVDEYPRCKSLSVDEGRLEPPRTEGVNGGVVEPSDRSTASPCRPRGCKIQFGDDPIDATVMIDTGASYYDLVLLKPFVDANRVSDRIATVVPRFSDSPGMTIVAGHPSAVMLGPFEITGADRGVDCDARNPSMRAASR